MGKYGKKRGFMRFLGDIGGILGFTGLASEKAQRRKGQMKENENVENILRWDIISGRQKGRTDY